MSLESACSSFSWPGFYFVISCLCSSSRFLIGLPASWSCQSVSSHHWCQRCFSKHHLINCSTVDSLFLLPVKSRFLFRCSCLAFLFCILLLLSTQGAALWSPWALLFPHSAWDGMPVLLDSSIRQTPLSSQISQEDLTLLSQLKPRVLSVIFLDFRFDCVLLKILLISSLSIKYTYLNRVLCRALHYQTLTFASFSCPACAHLELHKMRLFSVTGVLYYFDYFVFFLH